jgi:hypothetical protein
MPELRLIESKDRTVLGFGEATAKLRAASELRAEALAIEACHGKNAYSDFLRKHGARPDADQAATMGRWMGARVMASDGTMQPPLTASELAAARENRRRRRAAVQVEVEIRRLSKAISGLAENTKSPDELFEHLSPDIDEPEIRAQLRRAVQWLNRYDQEWRRREENRT